METLLGLFLISIITTMSFALIQSYSQVLKVSSAKDASISGLQIGLSRIRHELQSAYALSIPAVGGNDSQLEMKVLNRGYTLPSPVPSNWSPTEASRLSDVRYFVDENRLMRSDSSTGQSTVVLFEVSALDFERSPNQMVIRMSFVRERVVRSYRAVVTAPCLFEAP